MKRDPMDKEWTLQAIAEYQRLANECGFCETPADLAKANLYASLGILRALQHLVETL